MRVAGAKNARSKSQNEGQNWGTFTLFYVLRDAAFQGRSSKNGERIAAAIMSCPGEICSLKVGWCIRSKRVTSKLLNLPPLPPGDGHPCPVALGRGMAWHDREASKWN